MVSAIKDNMHKNVIAFSGGRTSGYMLHCLLNQYGREEIVNKWKILFCNTGRERNETLDFVHEVESRWQLPIVWLEYTRVPATQAIADIYSHTRSKKIVIEQASKGEMTHWFRIADYDKARRIGQPNLPFDELLGWMNVLPNVRARACTGQMKIRTMTRYLQSIGCTAWSDHIGIRHDESDRSLQLLAKSPKHITPQFPLIKNGTTEEVVLDFWKRQPFNLQLQSYEGNCDLCFLKTRDKKHRIIMEQPGSADWWDGWEVKFGEKASIKGDGKIFRKSHEYARLKQEASQADLPPYTRDDITPISCGCFDGGHKGVDLEESAE